MAQEIADGLQRDRCPKVNSQPGHGGRHAVRACRPGGYRLWAVDGRQWNRGLSPDGRGARGPALAETPPGRRWAGVHRGGTPEWRCRQGRGGEGRWSDQFCSGAHADTPGANRYPPGGAGPLPRPGAHRSLAAAGWRSSARRWACDRGGRSRVPSAPRLGSRRRAAVQRRRG